MYREITSCRICHNKDLFSVLNLGKQALTGIFLKRAEEKAASGPLQLVKCMDQDNQKSCGLLQLKHSYLSEKIYGQDYGYRSGLNSSMARHLKNVVDSCLKKVSLKAGDLIIDIGSNDGTLLNSYPDKNYLLVGIDPTAGKFRKYYADNVRILPEFFSSGAISRAFGNKRAKIVTSIAMIYDLENPVDFIRQVCDLLDKDGVWVFEQSYMPLMIERNAYDTVCHEHLEYYSLKQIKWMLDRAGLKIIDLALNDINGGSFQVTAVKQESLRYKEACLIGRLIENEKQKKLNTITPYLAFRDSIGRHKEKLLALIKRMEGDGEMILGYGASTKGNVILQYCGLTAKQLPFIADVNDDKFGRYTPGTQIPIISESEAKAMNPDYFLVLPWHFRENFISREKGYLNRGGGLIFPLPEIEIIDRRKNLKKRSRL